MIIMLFSNECCLYCIGYICSSTSNRHWSVGQDTADTELVETGDVDETGLIIDTSDTEETDTQDTDTNHQPDQYTADDLMMGNYLEFKEDLFWSMIWRMVIVYMPTAIFYVSSPNGRLLSV